MTLLADGSLLVFASWIRCDPYTSEGTDYAKPCKKGEPPLYSGALHQVVAGKDTVLRRGDDMLFPVWTDGGRILVRSQDSRLLLLSSSGATLRTFDLGTDFAQAVFQGTRLAVLRPTALDVYDTGSGASVHSLRLRRTPRQLADLQGGIVVLVAGGAVHLVQIDTGKGVTIVPQGGGAVRAQLEPSGLFYSSADGLAFVPMATVLGRFRTT